MAATIGALELGDGDETMIAETVYGHNDPEVGITPRSPDELGCGWLVGIRAWPGTTRVYWAGGPDLEWCDYTPVVHLALHSAALNFGYYGAGPLDLSYSVLLAVTGSGRTAHALYHQFCREVIARQPREGFALPVYRVRRWLAEAAHEGEVA